MRELKTEIDIAAPPKKVWDVLLDFNSWKEWNPIAAEAKGNPSPGEKLHMKFVCDPESKKIAEFKPIVIEAEAPIRFRWRATMMAPFLFSNDKVFELEETASGTRLIHREQFSGFMVLLFWSKFEKSVVPMLESMNKALKVKVEGLG